MSSFEMSFDLSAFDDQVDELEQAVAEAVRPAAAVAGQVIYAEVKRNVRSMGRITGNLDSAIYLAYSESESIPGQLAVYHVSWNSKKAPHGHLLEYGHLQRYVVYIDKTGLWRTAIRPAMRGQPKPKRKAAQSVKNAYYVPLAGGPRQVGARPFLRPAVSVFDDALSAAIDEIVRRVSRGRR